MTSYPIESAGAVGEPDFTGGYVTHDSKKPSWVSRFLAAVDACAGLAALSFVGWILYHAPSILTDQMDLIPKLSLLVLLVAMALGLLVFVRAVFDEARHLLRGTAQNSWDVSIASFVLIMVVVPTILLLTQRLWRPGLEVGPTSSVVTVKSASGQAGSSTLDPCAPQPHGSVPTPATPTLFANLDRSLACLILADGQWHAPREVDVDTQVEVGFTVARSEKIGEVLASSLSKVPSTPAGPLRVGPDMSATLGFDPVLVQVGPAGAVKRSTGSNIDLKWTWTLHPNQPEDNLVITAKVTVLIDGEQHQLGYDFPYTMRVHRTWAYTVGQVFTSYATWAALAGSTSGFVLWLWRRKQTSTTDPPKEHAPPRRDHARERYPRHR